MKLFGVSFILATAVAFLAYGADPSLAANLRNPSVVGRERELSVHTDSSSSNDSSSSSSSGSKSSKSGSKTGKSKSSKSGSKTGKSND
mmetsp:Transcript_14034/g.25369  ORF Transcript_14034/g.25369 Transcript_14034/m.25369 type:complete len:88 (-) Transcript_14034:297-560(-)